SGRWRRQRRLGAGTFRVLRAALLLGHRLEEDQLGAGVLRHLFELGLAEVVPVDLHVPALDGQDDEPGLADALPDLDSLADVDLHGRHPTRSGWRAPIYISE